MILMAQGARPAALEADNANLHSELEQGRRALVEAESVWDSLSVGWTVMEQECVKLRAGMDALNQEKAKIMADRETKLATEEKKFQDYRVRHRKKLHDLRVVLERAMNEIGTRCLRIPQRAVLSTRSPRGLPRRFMRCQT
jgi:hypothetical protein